jgi:type IV pilus assembly protein PilY1
MRKIAHLPTDGARSVGRRAMPAVLACMATLLSLPISAVTIPAIPLQSGAAYPPANVMFILDDSGSMEYVAMPQDITSDSRLDDDPDDKSSVNNTIYYNPKIDYQAWIRDDGSRYTGGLSYRDAYSHASLLSGSADLADDTQTYFVPKPGVTDFSKTSNFNRYQILWVRVGGTWTLKVEECTRYKSGSWSNCSYQTPQTKDGTRRSEAGEQANFAAWYSYHRTRIKVAKAGASEAFARLGSSIRVGYDSIWNRNAMPIPVSSGGGLFTGTNRSDWFSHLQAANGSGGTPLKGALQRTGEYFSDATAGGPWGPGSGRDQISCRQNFAILTTDGYWNDNSGYTEVGDADGTSGPEIFPPKGRSYSYQPAKPYSDNFVGRRGNYSQPDTLADVAMYYWKRDLVAALANNVPKSTADEAFWQHMVTFGISIGLKGRLTPPDDLDAIRLGTKHWGDPTDDEDLDRIDDLWHASVNGRGSFVSATNPEEFVEGLLDALTTVAERPGSASNVTANSTSFQTSTHIYQASYVSGRWTGELSAYAASRAGSSGTASWNASEHIPTSGRKVFTWSGSSGATFPSAAQVTALARGGGLAPVTGSDNANYIVGDQTLERARNGKLRDRSSLLGDIANSSPMYASESNTIFVGANDGMLHAIDASSGAERFAYVPAGIDLSALASLSDPEYTHRFFVDGPIAVSTTKQTPGRNYLVGALGRGGKGVFGLDVTDPGNFATGDVLWQRSDDADMGNVLGDPLVVTLNVTDADGNPRKAVLVGNGINSSTGTAALFVIDIASGAVIKEINTGATGDNGLSAPRGADLNGDGTVDRVWAGDLKGNVWRFDVGQASTDSWTVSRMFQATDGSGNAQPITTGLAIARQPTTGKLWVFVGTGSFLTTADVKSTAVQSMYGLVDDGSSSLARSDLVERQIVVATTKDGREVRAFERAGTMPADKQGWVIDLDNPSPGERIVSNPRVRGNVLLTASLIPPKDDTCDAGGTGYLNAVDAFTGTSLGAPYFDANNNGDFTDDTLPGDGDDPLPIGSVGTEAMPTLPVLIDDRVFWGESDGGNDSLLVNPQGGSVRRVSWREILLD